MGKRPACGTSVWCDEWCVFACKDQAKQEAKDRRDSRAFTEPSPLRVTKFCHYCGDVATTRDHIVPRSRLTDQAQQDVFGTGLNIVPACVRCNQAKGRARSDCDCPICSSAWVRWGPAGWASLPVVSLVRTRDARSPA